MSWQLRSVLLCIMSIALGCGFLHHLVDPEHYNFERLHIFFFNLCSGGTLLIYYSQGQRQLSPLGRAFLLLSILFALTAFLHWYTLTLIIPLILMVLVEKVRVDHFGSLWPKALCSVQEPVARKFHQAALLCLSLGLLFSIPVILNAEFLHWFEIPKLQLDTFFLGFSFPLSLISMSVIFGLMQKKAVAIFQLLKESIFWNINLGVIIFFVFILAGFFQLQVLVATILFLTVALILYLYWHEGIRLQQKAFLTSGIFFLLVASVTGIACIFSAFSEGFPRDSYAFLLRLHAFAALYGWNLSGLVVISRHDDFPLQLHSGKVIVLHWLIVLVFCPLGYFLPAFAVLAVLTYTWLLRMLFFNKGAVDRQLLNTQQEGW